MKTQIFTLFLILIFASHSSLFAGNYNSQKNLKKDQQTISIFPNPIDEKGNIKIILEEPTDLKIEFFDLTGKKVMEIKKNYLESGEQLIEFRAKELKEGIYLCKISANNWEKAQRMIIRH